MKNYLILWLLVLLAACQPSGRIFEVLNEAEGLLRMHQADSAYTLLKGIPNLQQYSEKEQARWCLLMTLAIDKTNRTHTSDSLICFAIRYYEKKNDFSNLASAFYLQGCVEKELGDYEKAAHSFLSALTFSQGSKHYKLQILAASHLGNIFAYSNLTDKALTAYKLAFDFAEQAKDSINLSFVSAYLGRIYAKNKDWEKADLYYQKAIELAELIGDDHALKLSVQELTSVYRRQNLLDKALMLVSRLSVYDKNNNYPDNRSRHLIIGNTYLKIGQLDSAYYYIQYAVGSDDIHVRRSSYQALYNLYKQREQYAKATYFNELYIACQDSIESMGKLIDLSLITKEHDERIQKKVIWSKIFCFVGSTVIVLLLLGGLFYWHSQRRWREELERKKEEMEMLEQIEREIVRQLELEQQTHKAVREEADRNLELVLAQENQLKDLHAQKHVLEQEIETLNKKLGEAGIFSALRQIEQQSLFERKMFAFLAEMKVNPRSLLKDEIKDLDLFIGQKYAKERKAHPGMTVTDWRYWLLTRMEFSNENMATLMNVRIDSVYKQKQRVKEHLNQKNKPMSKS